MAFTKKRFIQLRPYLYHLTAADNIPRIQRMRELSSAAKLKQASGLAGPNVCSRKGLEVINIHGESVILRDQDPLYERNLLLTDGWNFSDFLSLLDRFVYFWPGTQEGPETSGVGHYKRYKNTSIRMLRIETAMLFKHVSHEPHVSRYNSGSPRMNNGQRIPRGSGTFVQLDLAPFNAGEVIELVYENSVSLPAETEVSRSIDGPWTKF